MSLSRFYKRWHYSSKMKEFRRSLEKSKREKCFHNGLNWFVAGKPFPVRNCTLANQTYTSVEVKCVPGYDGGLPQKFVLEVYHGDLDFLPSIRPLYNVSALEEPVFALSGLEASVDAGVHVAIYAVNAKGRSQSVILGEVTFRDAEKRTGKFWHFYPTLTFITDGNERASKYIFLPKWKNNENIY